MSSRMASRAARGFTLVEMLLAVSLMSMLLALAYGGLRAATQATERGQTILDDSNRIRMAHQFVRRQLTQMLPLSFEEDPAQDVRIVFTGESQRIRYVAPMPGYLGFGGPQVQELELVRGEESMELVLRHALLQGFEEDYLYAREPILLLDKIDRAAFSFLGEDENGEITQWSERWENGAFLPAAVSFEVEFIEDVYIHWPLLATSVRVNGVNALDDEAGVMSKDYTATIRELMNKRGKQQ